MAPNLPRNCPNCCDEWLTSALFLAESTDKYLIYVNSVYDHYVRRWRQIENGKEIAPVFKRPLAGRANTQGGVEKHFA